MGERITLSYGDGMRDTYNIIRDVFLSSLSNPSLRELNDSARIGEFVFSCDSFTVKPLFFPDSDIGKLSIYGTVNDICVSAAEPLYLSLAIIVEEGFVIKTLEKIVSSIKIAAKNSGIKVVTGDFKVVEKKKIDGIFISTAGIGKRLKGRSSSFRKIKVGDKVIITGGIAEHGITILLSRNKIFDFDIKSDCQCLNKVLIPLWKKFSSIRFMRDPTRGGLASVLNEISLNTNLGIKIFENNIPLRKDVKAASELLGVDPYYLASEGRAVIVISKEKAKEAIKFLHNNGFRKASIIGTITKQSKVIIKTVSGGERILDFSYSLNLPRIC